MKKNQETVTGFVFSEMTDRRESMEVVHGSAALFTCLPKEETERFEAEGYVDRED